MVAISSNNAHLCYHISPRGPWTICPFALVEFLWAQDSPSIPDTWQKISLCMLMRAFMLINHWIHIIIYLVLKGMFLSWNIEHFLPFTQRNMCNLMHNTSPSTPLAIALCSTVAVFNPSLHTHLKMASLGFQQWSNETTFPVSQQRV